MIINRALFPHCEQMTRSSANRLLLPLVQRGRHHSPRPRPPGLCWPKRASPACDPRASAPAASPPAAWQLSASSGAPASRPPPRATRVTAHRVTTMGLLTVSPIITKSVRTSAPVCENMLLSIENPQRGFHKNTVMIGMRCSLFSFYPTTVCINSPLPHSLCYGLLQPAFLHSVFSNKQQVNSS